MDVVIVPADGCIYECLSCPYSSKKPTKTATPPHEVPDGLLVFCPGALSFPQMFEKIVHLAEMSDFAVLMASINEDPPDFSMLSKFDLVLAVAPSVSHIDQKRHKAEERLEAHPSTRLAVPFSEEAIEEVLELQSPAMISPPMVSRPTIEEVEELEGIRLSDKGFSRVSIGARAVRLGFVKRRNVLFFMISSALYDRPFKLVTPSGTKITTFAKLTQREVEAIVRVDLKLKDGKIVPDKLLRILDLIDNKGNLTRVAEILGTTYQNVSQTVRRYEKILNTQLIQSTPGKGGGAKLTPEGKKLLALRRDIKSNVETL